MATFIENAKAVLSSEDFTQLESLATKVANFESTNEEDKALQELKAKVKSAVAIRDKQVHLSFLKDGDFTFSEVLPLLTAGKEEKIVKELIAQALETIYPKAVLAPTEIIANFTVPKYIDVSKNKALHATETEVVSLKWNETIDRRISKAIETGKNETLIAGLTDFGKTWLKVSIEGKGPAKGKFVFPNVNAITTRFKELDKVALLKSLEEKKPKGK